MHLSSPGRSRLSWSFGHHTKGVGDQVGGKPPARSVVEAETLDSDVGVARRKPVDQTRGPMTIGSEPEDRVSHSDFSVTAWWQGATPAERRTALVVALAGATPVGVVVGLVDDLQCSTIVVPAADGPRLADPSMREQVIALAGKAQVAETHRQLAIAWSSRDPSMAALHRAAATDAPDEKTAVDLEDEARTAAARGANGIAAALLTSAADHSSELEPRRRRLLAAARAASTDADHATVRTLVAALEALGGSASQRAEAAFLGGYSEMWAGDPTKATAMLLRAADASRHEPLAPLLLVTAAVAANLAGDVHTALSIARRAADGGGEGPGASIGTRAARAVEVYASAVAGEPDAGERARNLAQHLDLSGRMPPTEMVVASTVAGALVVVDDHARAERILATLQAVAEIGGMTEVLPVTLCHRAELATRVGLWHRARALAEAAETAAAASGAVTSLAYACAALARVTAGQGDMDAAHAALDRARRTAQPIGAVEAHRRIDVAAGALAVAERRPGQALVPLLAAADASERAGIGDALHGPWALELLDIGSVTGAGPSLERAVSAIGDSAARARRPALEASLARARATVALPHDPDAGQALLGAADALDRCGLVIDAARARLVAGEHLRRHGHPRDARAPLELASERFDAAGAVGWATRARFELRAAGGDRIATGRLPQGALSTQELRVARHAASGATNDEIATDLGLSPKTIENTLTRVYAKLHVRRRTDLARALDQTGSR
jgi:DNA-binding CsgD family transcriptional regulator